MVQFLAGFLLGLVLMTIIIKYNISSLNSLINQGKLVERDLEKLCERSLQISNNLVKNLEEKVIQAQDLVVQKDVDDPTSETQRTYKPTKKIKTKDFVVKLSDDQKIILELAKSGNSVKEIAQKLGLEQDHVAMVVQLFNK